MQCSTAVQYRRSRKNSAAQYRNYYAGEAGKNSAARSRIYCRTTAFISSRYVVRMRTSTPLSVFRTTDRAGRAPTRPFCDTRPMGGWASFSFFCSGRAGGRRLKIHAGPGGWAVDISTGRPWASPGFWPFFTEGQGCFFKAQTKGFFHIEYSEPSICLSAAFSD